MEKQVALVLGKDEKERQRRANAINNVCKKIAIDLKINQFKERERIGKGALFYFSDSLNPNSPPQIFARKMQEEEPYCARILMTSLGDLIEQDKNHPSKSLLSNYLNYKGEAVDLDKEDFRIWFRTYYPTFHDIVIENEEDENSLETETKNAMDYVREQGKICQPKVVSIIGLGTLGLGTLDKIIRQSYVSKAPIHSDFVDKYYDGNYDSLLKSLDLPGSERDKIKPGSLDDLFDEEPETLIIATGKHEIDFSKYKKRTELVEMFLKTSIPKVKSILEKAVERDYKGLIVMQTNPNGHLIAYARHLGIKSGQLTSFTPDTVRHKTALYETLKEIDSTIKQDEIDLIAIGEHMKGGTPVYDTCKVRGKPLLKAFPQLSERLPEICERGRGKGLEVMQSWKIYDHEYRGVPELIKGYIKDIAHFKEHTRHPAYCGVLSVPARFTYRGKGDNINIGIEKTANISDFTRDKHVLSELRGDIKEIVRLTRPYLE